MPDIVTTNRGYQLPHEANDLDHDVLRLVAALEAIDVDVADLFVQLALKAAISHQHVFGDIPGLVEALAGKAAAGHVHALGDLSDVAAAGAANGQVIKRVGSAWQAANVQPEDVAGLVAALAAKADAAAVLADLAGKMPLAGASTKTGVLTVQPGASNANTDWFILRPSDWAAGKPYFAIKKLAGATAWSLILWDGASSAGSIDFNATFLSHNSNPLTTKASVANVRSAAAGNLAVTADLVASASGIVTLADGATIAVDWNSFINGIVTLAGNRSIGNPVNAQPGTWRTIYVSGNDGNARTLSFGNQFAGSLPTLNDITNAKSYLISIYCMNPTFFILKATQGFP